ncbi:FT-interacting protein 3-like [Rhododendron vialii]|uniref:FT-interacting protein 3-like n=1 Tax=Rhododendron vialii TaxID=182163 RepID=UPI00265FCC70|nr:FT-interacting protein 3-like [Rhododendron vialii]
MVRSDMQLEKAHHYSPDPRPVLDRGSVSELILPTIFLCLFLIGVWNYRSRPHHPPHTDIRFSRADDAPPDELEEEFDTFPTSCLNDTVRARYDRLRNIAGRIEIVMRNIATQGERLQSLLSWQDPRLTALFYISCLVAAIVLYVTPFQVVALLAGVYVLRHPRFRLLCLSICSAGCPQGLIACCEQKQVFASELMVSRMGFSSSFQSEKTTQRSIEIACFLSPTGECWVLCWYDL